MNKFERIATGIASGLLVVIVATVILAWAFTFLNITYGLAIWSNQWLLSLLGV